MEQGDVPANVQYDEKQIVPVVATVLTQLVARNDKMLEQVPPRAPALLSTVVRSISAESPQ